MPRQAARLVLGRSARSAKPTTTATHQPFSTTPRHFADNNPDDSTPTRAARSTSAALALSGLTRASPTTPSSSGGNNNIVRPPPGLGRPGANVISLKSLPMRRPAQLGGMDERPAPGSPNFVPRFGGRAGGGGFGGGSDQGASGRGGFGAGRGGFGGGGGRGDLRGARGGVGQARGGRNGVRGRGGSGGGGGGGRGGRGGGSGGGSGDRDPRDEGGADEDLNAPLRLGESLLETVAGGGSDPAVVKYQEELRSHGPERAYTPSVTLASLMPFGPAVATNTAMGQVAMAMRSMRLVGGGRRFHEGEQSFDVLDEQRWRSARKPILYSRIEQKEAALTMLAPERRERAIERAMEQIVYAMQDEHGQDWSGFAKAFDGMGRDEIRRQAEAKVDARLAHALEDKQLLRTKNKTTREAVAKFVLRGEYALEENAADTHGKAARYHALTPTYRPVDGDKFDAKLKQLVKS